MAKPEKPAGAPAAGAKPASVAKGGGTPAKGKAQAAAKGELKEKAVPARARSTGTIPPRLRERYRALIIPALMKERGYKNPNEAPRLDKIVLNMGLGEATQNPKVLDSAVEELAAISGQKPVVTRARKAISNFKLREGLSIGAMVTLRGDRMYEFLDRLLTASLPRVRDFKGVSDRSFDGRGNYSLGVREQVIFPEINLDKVDKIKGLTITICTTARSDAEGKALLRALGLPFRA